MSEYINRLLYPGSASTLHHVVDVGSGQVSIFFGTYLRRFKNVINDPFQGYLSRALSDLGLHVLALDSNQNQTSGAERWKAKEAARRQRQLKLKGEKGARSKPNLTQQCNGPSSALFQLHVPTSVPSASVTNECTMHSRVGSLTHQTICIDRHTLDSSIHDWLLSGEAIQIAGSVKGGFLVNGTEPRTSQAKPTPVMMVALHACGSLTPDVLRAFLSNHRRPSVSDTRIWTPQALVVVGCCYNLMVPEGEPRFLWPVPPQVCYSYTDRFSLIPVASSANTSSNTTSCLSPPCCANPISVAP
jgi:hypothetical protein